MMNHATLEARELASALADGELQGDALRHALEVLETDEAARSQWHAYHLVGDVLRSGAGAAIGAHDAAFVARLRQRLQEPTERASFVQAGALPVQHSANDPVWRWKLVAGLSTLTAAAVLGWQLVGDRTGADAAVQMAIKAPTVNFAQAADGVMIRDPRLDQLLAAHQQLGGTSALQMPAGFLRNATFERPAR